MPENFSLNPSHTLGEGTAPYVHLEQELGTYVSMQREKLHRLEQLIPQADEWRVVGEQARISVISLYKDKTGVILTEADIPIAVHIPEDRLGDFPKGNDSYGFFHPLIGNVVGVPKVPGSLHQAMTRTYHETFHASGETIITGAAREERYMWGLRARTKVSPIVAKSGLWTSTVERRHQMSGLEESMAHHYETELMLKDSSDQVLKIKKLFLGFALDDIEMREKIKSLPARQIHAIEKGLFAEQYFDPNEFQAQELYQALLERAEKAGLADDLERMLLLARIDGRHVRGSLMLLKDILQSKGSLAQEIYRAEATDTKTLQELTRRVRPLSFSI